MAEFVSGSILWMVAWIISGLVYSRIGGEVVRLKKLVQERDLQLAAILGAAEGWVNKPAFPQGQIAPDSPVMTEALRKVLLLRGFIEWRGGEAWLSYLSAANWKRKHASTP